MYLNSECIPFCLPCKIPYNWELISRSSQTVLLGKGKGQGTPRDPKDQRNVEVLLSSFLTSAIEGVLVNTTPRPFTPEKESVPILQGAPTGIRSPERPAISEAIYWLIYPGLNQFRSFYEMFRYDESSYNERRIFRIINYRFWSANFYLSLIIQFHTVLTSSLSQTSVTNV
jgi:hypothetical protein